MDAYIQASVDRLLENGQAPSDGMLFLGNWHDAMPRMVFSDPVLKSVDRNVWAVIRTTSGAGSMTAFPGYREIAARANIQSDATVARAIAILRITRWLSLCVRVRDRATGRFRGNVYALHDEPLPLVDALHLDPEYMDFLRRCTRQTNKQVRAVALGRLPPSRMICGPA